MVGVFYYYNSTPPPPPPPPVPPVPPVESIKMPWKDVPMQQMLRRSNEMFMELHSRSAGT